MAIPRSSRDAALAGEDAGVVAVHFLRTALGRAGATPSAADEAFVAREAASTSWPGGARQLRHHVAQAVQLREAGRGVESAWPRRALAVAASPTGARSEAAYSPAQLGRWVADAAFLLAARSARSRTELAARTQMTWQGADQRLAAMGVRLGDAAALEARYEATLGEVRALVAAEPGLAALVAALREG